MNKRQRKKAVTRAEALMELGMAIRLAGEALTKGLTDISQRMLFFATRMTDWRTEKRLEKPRNEEESP